MELAEARLTDPGQIKSDKKSIILDKPCEIVIVVVYQCFLINQTVIRYLSGHFAGEDSRCDCLTSK
jgi:hypothetical protein